MVRTTLLLAAVSVVAGAIGFGSGELLQRPADKPKMASEYVVRATSNGQLQIAGRGRVELAYARIMSEGVCSHEASMAFLEKLQNSEIMIRPVTPHAVGYRASMDAQLAISPVADQMVQLGLAYVYPPRDTLAGGKVPSRLWKLQDTAQAHRAGMWSCDYAKLLRR